MSIKKILSNYLELLIVYWDIIDSLSKYDQTGSLIIDWQQANWEVIVEGMLGDSNIALEPYGDGADCNGASSRVLYPERQPTHRIICVPIKDGGVRDVLNDRDLDPSEADIIFDRFVILGDDGWYYEKPKFDHILAEYNGAKVVVDFKKIEFELRQI